jgi:hypothetical protein
VDLCFDLTIKLKTDADPASCILVRFSYMIVILKPKVADPDPKVLSENWLRNNRIRYYIQYRKEWLNVDIRPKLNQSIWRYCRNWAFSILTQFYSVHSIDLVFRSNLVQSNMDRIRNFGLNFRW